jgi:ADP-heptose:LPS heptosyltransferase
MTIPQYIKEWTKDFISNLKLQERTIIGIHPGAGQWCPEKRWPTEKFIGLMRNLSAEFNDSIILVFIGPDDKDIGNEIKEKIAGPYVKIIEEPNIIKVSGLVEQCNIFISNDTGLMHIADILGIPLAVIWGPTSLTKNRPLNKLSVIIRKDLPCMPCYEIGREISCQHRLCLTQIDIEEVMQVCRDLLKKIKDLKAEKGRISKCS